MPRLWLDTNVARSAKRIAQLCRLATQKGVEVVIHPQVYLERRRQMRAQEGANFDGALFDGFLARQGIQVPVFTLDQPRASAWADALSERYPSDKAWEAAKKGTLGGQLQKAFAVLPGSMPITTDWLISLLVEHEPSSRAVTEDRKEEWRFLREAEPRRALGWEEAFSWLQSLPDVAHHDEKDEAL
ncbi:hypothetical protein [Chondromyces apiculatus]|uniref:PIN domain-containing protein n=1 Tax=Chondromyces apiculatus DSM 436 TaxID=1192034 RepID=A0A017TD24_9BACT|nr:hypothetical protein [Chondromyces apiculatus]EYF07119.1 Hypothetical protein CAP_0598 [Chondromyces apiculatus DSM 436]